MAVCHFVLFLLDIALSIPLRFTDSDYPFGIVKLFFKMTIGLTKNTATIALSD
jgi:hypothetical protein